MNEELIWRMRVAHSFIALIGVSLSLGIVFLLGTGAPLSPVAIIAMAVLLVFVIAYVTIGVRYLAGLPSPGDNSARLLRSTAYLVYPAFLGVFAITLVPLLLVDNRVLRSTPGGTALTILLIGLALVVVIIAILFGRWHATLRDLENTSGFPT